MPEIVSRKILTSRSGSFEAGRWNDAKINHFTKITKVSRKMRVFRPNPFKKKWHRRNFVQNRVAVCEMHFWPTLGVGKSRFNFVKLAKSAYRGCPDVLKLGNRPKLQVLACFFRVLEVNQPKLAVFAHLPRLITSSKINFTSWRTPKTKEETKDSLFWVCSARETE